MCYCCFKYLSMTLSNEIVNKHEFASVIIDSSWTENVLIHSMKTTFISSLIKLLKIEQKIANTVS